MTTQLSPAIFYRDWDNQGNALAFGSVSTYAAGTSNPQATYTDSTGTTPNANPVVLNARGEAEIWLSPTLTYKFVVTDRFGNLIRTVDQVNGALAATGNIIPGITNLYTLGSPTYSWAQLYLGVNAEPALDTTTGIVGYYPRTAAEIAATVVPVSFGIAPGNVLRYETNTTPGTTDMTAGFQAAVNQQKFGGSPVYAPAGTYNIAGTITVSSSAGFRMYGDGMGLTVISGSGTADLFDVTSSTSANAQISIENMTVTTTTVSTGAAFNLTCPGIIPSVTVRNVTFASGNPNHFTYYFLLNSCGDCNFERVFVSNPTTSGTAFYVQSTQAATVYKFIGCSVYGCAYGIYSHNTTNPGIEGLQCYGCDFVSNTSSVYMDNTQSVAYGAPQFTWQGGHSNCNGINFNLQGIYQPLIQGALIYNAGSSEAIALTQCSDANVSNNVFELGGGTAAGITLGQAAVSSITGGNISNNVFRLGAGATAVILTTAATITDLLVQNNERFGGSYMFTATGTMTATTLIKNNVPLDSADVTASGLAVTATGMTLVGYRPPFINLTTPGGATTITNLVPRGPGDVVTLSSNSTLITIQHNGSANGFFLNGGNNYTFTASYSRITLSFQPSNNFWVEVCRS